MDYTINMEAATRYGVHEALLLNNLFFWVQKNRANKRHYHDGRYWTYNSMEAFAELFPCFTHRQVQTAIKNLRDKGAIVTGNYNKSPYDRTLWYSLTDEAMKIYRDGLDITKEPKLSPFCEMENQDLQNEKNSNAKSLHNRYKPYNNSIYNNEKMRFKNYEQREYPEDFFNNFFSNAVAPPAGAT